MDNEKLKLAGKIASQARAYSLTLAKEGVNVKELSNKIEKKIVELGGKPAFPVCISINDVAAHYVPSAEDKTILKKDDLVKIDLGVHIDGFIADTAISTSIGKNSENEKLIAASEKALAAAIKLAKPGVKLREIGKAISEEIESAGFKPIRNLFGHHVEEYNLHAGMNIPNYDNKDNTELEEGMVIAIEPFATTGDGYIKDAKNVEVFKIVGPGNLRTNRDILEYVFEEYNLLPFAKRWLVAKFGILKTNLFLKEASAKGILMEHHVLTERTGGKVAQTEHTIIVSNKPTVTTE